MRKQLLSIVVILVVLSLSIAAAPAHASGEKIVITGLNSHGCDQGQSGFHWKFTASNTNPYDLQLLVKANGVIIMNENDSTVIDPQIANNGHDYHIYYTNSAGPAAINWPMAPNTIATIIMNVYPVGQLGTGPILTSSSLTFNCTTGAIIGHGSSGLLPFFTDGRLNNNDAGETAAVYCLADGSVKVLAIYNGVGYLAFTASPAEIAAVPKKPAKNTLIKEGKGARLYRLTSGELQINRAFGPQGPDYVFIFTDCAVPTK